ncbi:unnamed protein product [Cuscuta epithymum]|uniref:Uncharacterized protein n=1 Tax=Cuscuta epithymum TaxID=186058 RepID=A0AAV0D1W6_9ASTE|nr:unnamed protein product [Cuscuta epithymum]
MNTRWLSFIFPMIVEKRILLGTVGGLECQFIVQNQDNGVMIQWSDNSWHRYPIPATSRTPKPKLFINSITCNGTIYWLNCDDVPDCIIACDLVNEPYSSASINLHEGSMPGGRGVVSLELGAVPGERRLFNVFRLSSGYRPAAVSTSRCC